MLGGGPCSSLKTRSLTPAISIHWGECPAPPWADDRQFPFPLLLPPHPLPWRPSDSLWLYRQFPFPLLLPPHPLPWRPSDSLWLFMAPPRGPHSCLVPGFPFQAGPVSLAGPRVQQLIWGVGCQGPDPSSCSCHCPLFSVGTPPAPPC